MNNNINGDNILHKIDKLEQMSKEILDLKKQFRQRRPIIIEFCGSPKSGKTSCITSLNLFLKRNDFNTAILTERASVCPISNKKDPMFNIWTLCSSINGINESLYSYGDKVDIVICDRGIFDSLCWFEWLKSQKFMSNEDYKTIFKFATFEKWLKRIDLVYVFVARPDISISREYANLLTRKEGSIMNIQALTQYKDAISKVKNKHGSLFHNVKLIDTSDIEQNDVGYEVTSTTLTTLRDMLMEKIGYLDNKVKSKLSYGVNDFSLIKEDINNIHFDKREIVEKSENIQPIPIAVITNHDRSKVLLVRKTDKSTKSKSSPERGKDLLYVGGHIRSEDMSDKCRNNFISLAISTLEREVKEEIGISVTFDNILPFIIYTPSQGSNRHFAICFVLEIDIENTRIILDRYELVQKTGTSKSGRTIDLYDISNHKYNFEPWSIEILKTVFKKNISKEYNIQRNLFDNL